MSILNKTAILGATSTKLISHGLTATIEQDTETKENHINDFSIFVTPENCGIDSNDKDFNADEFITMIIEDVCEDRFKCSVDDVLWCGIYNNGYDEIGYTAHTPTLSADQKLCGVMIIEKSEVLERFNVNDIDIKTKALLLRDFDNQLREWSAWENKEVYTVTVKTEGDKQPSVFVKNKCFNIDHALNKIVNIGINEVIKDIDENGIKVSLLVDPDLYKNDVNLGAYINREIYRELKFKLPVGSITYDAKTGVLDMNICSESIPSFGVLKDNARDNIFKRAVDNFKSINDIDSKDTSKDTDIIYDLLGVNSNSFGRDNLKEAKLKTLFDYVKGISFVSYIESATPF